MKFSKNAYPNAPTLEEEDMYDDDYGYEEEYTTEEEAQQEILEIAEDIVNENVEGAIFTVVKKDEGIAVNSIISGLTPLDLSIFSQRLNEKFGIQSMLKELFK